MYSIYTVCTVYVVAAAKPRPQPIRCVGGTNLVESFYSEKLLYFLRRYLFVYSKNHPTRSARKFSTISH